jgi:hypothetical protein
MKAFEPETENAHRVPILISSISSTRAGLRILPSGGTFNGYQVLLFHSGRHIAARLQVELNGAADVIVSLERMQRRMAGSPALQ